ncbi:MULTISPECIES: nickel-responsive transcriptional regulator NikR [Desulfonatronum]|jgi:CopG family transcriptional regulator, nickel-responsive regulator|uniref:nickel-responsive transcriptional regulator NikR n=1 Tax=Desulfonatronum TaxID=66848 RepID=UPI00048D3D63|nr:MULTISPECIES: nickel-responsive transcriptional regulator NikR [Desulfonatronum]SMP49465.1 transcriptional regulator, CopG family [Desulfonatronum zhilinae]
MGKTIRFGVSLDSDLLEKFDALCDERSYQTRSEAIRDLIRNMLVQKEWEDLDGETAGTLTMVYDHHQSDLAQKLTELQHDYLDIIVTSQHVHLDHHNCMEILVLRGTGERLRDLGAKLTATKGVKHGTLNLTTTGKNLE